LTLHHSRKNAILRLAFEPNTVDGWFDLEPGLMYRMSDSERVTAKRSTPAPLPRPLLAYLRL
jgi:hypothetical protein